jgi:TatD DNase family protein
LILVETDAPYLTPVPNRGRLNAPAQVAHTLRAIAEVKRVDVAELCAMITATGERVFGPSGNENSAPGE